MKKNLKKTVSKGWCGRWINGQLGWFMPLHATGHGDVMALDPNCAGEKAYRVKVTVEQVFDRNGKEIVRRFPKP